MNGALGGLVNVRGGLPLRSDSAFACCRKIRERCVELQPVLYQPREYPLGHGIHPAPNIRSTAVLLTPT